MRTNEQRCLNVVQRPECYREALLQSAGFPVALSVWEGAAGSPVVVFLPGTMTHPLFYEEFLDRLNRAGLTVVGVHLARHGKSPRTRRRITWDAVVTNALDAVSWARRSWPDAPVVVIGSSQGGVLAMAAAARADGVAAVFAHNVLDPALADSLSVTRAPRWLAPVYPVVRRALPALARLLPGLPVPFDLYLEMRRVSADPDVAEYFYTDPLGLRSYPLGFLAGMMTADPQAPARCDVVVVAGAGDPLFSLDYTRQVFDRIVAPRKELVVLDTDQHLVFNTSIDLVVGELLPRLRRYSRDRREAATSPSR